MVVKGKLRKLASNPTPSLEGQASSPFFLLDSPLGAIQHRPRSPGGLMGPSGWDDGRMGGWGSKMIVIMWAEDEKGLRVPPRISILSNLRC